MATVTHCPYCSHEMEIVALKCPSCGTGVTGRFHMDELLNLSDDQMGFVKVFLKNRGNLSEVQKELGISYPTARNRLNEIAEILGYEGDTERVNDKEVLEKLKNGEIDASTAISMLKGEKGYEND